jgi:hypothetical protein
MACDEALAAYLLGSSMAAVARAQHCAPGTVASFLDAHGIRRRSRMQQARTTVQEPAGLIGGRAAKAALATLAREHALVPRVMEDLLRRCASTVEATFKP